MPVEDLEARFWHRTTAVGGWLTVAIGVVGLTYGIAFAGSDHDRGVLIAIAVATVIGGFASRWIPWGRTAASGWRESALVWWSALLLGAIASMAASDGGATSPLGLALILPTLFASLAFSLRRVLLIGALAQVAFLALASLAAPDAGEVLLFCSILVGTTAVAAWQARIHREWRHELMLSSRTDPLTGLLNRRGLGVASAGAFSALSRFRHEVTLLVLDLDDFKAYNDLHGHKAGDELLRWTALQLSSAVRPSDAVARLGGDEFAILLPGSDRGGAAPVVERVWDALHDRIGFSMGLGCAPRDGESFDELYRVADLDLYGRKLARSRAELGPWSPEPMPARSRRSFSANAILAAVTEPFIVLDAQRRFSYVNGAAGRLLGRSSDGLLGQSISDLESSAPDSPIELIQRCVGADGRPALFVASCGSPQRRFVCKVTAATDGFSVLLHELGDEALGPPESPGRETMSG